MPAYYALALSVGLLAVLDTWLFVSPLAALLPGLVWVSFIAWGAHFHSGGGVRGASTAAVGMSFGAAIGMAAVMLASGPFTVLGQLAAPVAVGMGAAVICLASRVPLLEVIPASVYGFASIAGPILLAGRAPQDAFLPTVATVVVGAAFGYASEQLANVLTKKDAAAGSMAG